MSAKTDANAELRKVLDMTLYYAKHTFPWLLSQPIVFLCRSADKAGTKSSVNGNVLSALHVLFFGENEFDWDGNYLEGLEGLVQSDGIFYLEEQEIGDNDRVFEALNQVFGTAQPEATPENIALVRAQVLRRMTRDVAGLVNAHYHKTPDYKVEVMAVVSGPEMTAELEAAATEFLDTLGSDCNVGVV